MIYEAENSLEILFLFTIKYGESLGDNFWVKYLKVSGWICGHILKLFARTSPESLASCKIMSVMNDLWQKHEMSVFAGFN